MKNDRRMNFVNGEYRDKIRIRVFVENVSIAKYFALTVNALCNLAAIK